MQIQFVTVVSKYLNFATFVDLLTIIKLWFCSSFWCVELITTNRYWTGTRKDLATA